MNELTIANNAMIVAGQVANHYAADSAFADYISRRAINTITAQLSDLNDFAAYLRDVGVDCDGDDLQSTPACWIGVTWGIVDGYVRWMLLKGYAIGTINRRLATVKTYAKLAAKSSAISDAEHRLISTVRGYGGKEAKRVDEKRTKTRTGAKKPRHTTITEQQAQALKARPNTPQGRRDAVMMCLLLDHGLRAGEVAGLQVEDVDVATGQMLVDRPKVGIEEHRHKLTTDTLIALHNYIDSGDAPTSGPLLHGTDKSGSLVSGGMDRIAVSKRVAALGRRLKIDSLSAHDCRHYWATRWACKVDVLRLQEAGGWSSLDMPRRYVDRSKIANEGMA